MSLRNTIIPCPLSVRLRAILVSVSVAEEKSRDDASGGEAATLEKEWGAADLQTVGLPPKTGDMPLFEPMPLR